MGVGGEVEVGVEELFAEFVLEGPVTDAGEVASVEVPRLGEFTEGQVGRPLEASLVAGTAVAEGASDAALEPEGVAVLKNVKVALDVALVSFDGPLAVEDLLHCSFLVWWWRLDTPF